MGYKMIKMADSEEVLFSFRLPKDLREAFQRTCEGRDRNMSQELRAMIRGYNQRYAGKRRETQDMEVQDMDRLETSIRLGKGSHLGKEATDIHSPAGAEGTMGREGPDAVSGAFPKRVGFPLSAQPKRE